MATRCWGLLGGSILVVMASCADDNGSRSAAPTTAVETDVMLTVPTTSTAEGTITVTTTSTIEASTIVEPDATTGVLAAAVLWRATTGNSWDDPNRFNSFYVVGRLGHADANGFITLGAGRALTDAERAAIEAALAPGTVEWIDSRADVISEPPTVTIPEDRAIITMAEPTIDGGRAEVATELWCGFDCGIGSTSVLEQSPTGDWTVTEQIGGYVA
jgi:hypothetical protein